MDEMINIHLVHIFGYPYNIEVYKSVDILAKKGVVNDDSFMIFDSPPS